MLSANLFQYGCSDFSTDTYLQTAKYCFGTIKRIRLRVLDEVLHKKALVERIYKCLSLWSQQGMILRPPDYESGATNQLSYGTLFLLSFERLPRWAHKTQ